MHTRESMSQKMLTIYPIVKLMTFILILNYINANFEPCPFSIPTVSVVKKCPKEKTEWETAREKKQCHWITQNCTVAEKFQYHCLPTDTSGIFVEVCIPTIQIVGQFCPIYDMDLNQIRHDYQKACKDHHNPCPKVYISDIVHKYQGCFEEIVNSKKSYDTKTPDLTEPNGARVDPVLVMIFLILIILVVLKLIQMFCLEECKKLLKRIWQCNDEHNAEETEESRPLTPTENLPEDRGTGSFKVEDNSEGSQTKIMDSPGSIEVIHPGDQDLTGSRKEQPSSDLSGCNREQLSSAVMDNIVNVQEDDTGNFDSKELPENLLDI